jgi:hypothetical protein
MGGWVSISRAPAVARRLEAVTTLANAAETITASGTTMSTDVQDPSEPLAITNSGSTSAVDSQMSGQLVERPV